MNTVMNFLKTLFSVHVNISNAVLNSFLYVLLVISNFFSRNNRRFIYIVGTKYELCYNTINYNLIFLLSLENKIFCLTIFDRVIFLNVKSF